VGSAAARSARWTLNRLFSNHYFSFFKTSASLFLSFCVFLSLACFFLRFPHAGLLTFVRSTFSVPFFSFFFFSVQSKVYSCILNHFLFDLCIPVCSSKFSSGKLWCCPKNHFRIWIILVQFIGLVVVHCLRPAWDIST
jgi:hypothetical protein